MPTLDDIKATLGKLPSGTIVTSISGGTYQLKEDVVDKDVQIRALEYIPGLGADSLSQVTIFSGSDMFDKVVLPQDREDLRKR